VISIAPHADLAIYVRPGGKSAAGHGQPADLALLAAVVSRGSPSDLRSGWSVAVRDGVAVSVEEDSGLRSVGKADKRVFACIWSSKTRRRLNSG
jgi:hypothetical protein